MKLEVKKERIGSNDYDSYCVYIEDSFVILTSDKDLVSETIEKAKRTVLNRAIPAEVIYSEEF